MKHYPTTLIIAGSDSCGGAGIQADIKTCSALGVYATTAITAVTAQNTMGVVDVQAITPQMVSCQIKSVLDDLTVNSIKIGMLCNADIVKAVASALQDTDIPITLDPVMISTSGHKLLADDAIEAVTNLLFPLAEVITPNLHEASLLSGVTISNQSQSIVASHTLLSMGCKWVLIKGGHITNDDYSTDVLITSDDEPRYYTSTRIVTRNTHGTGCTLSSAIAAFRARGYDLCSSVSLAKEYVTQAIAHSACVHIGEGHGALNHAFAPQPLLPINM